MHLRRVKHFVNTSFVGADYTIDRAISFVKYTVTLPSLAQKEEYIMEVV